VQRTGGNFGSIRFNYRRLVAGRPARRATPI
jgi:hypothetical protein